MASTNKTPNYNLPQFVANDKPTWLGDFNSAMSNIDTAMHNNAQGLSQANNSLQDLQNFETNQSATNQQMQNNISGLQTSVQTLNSNLASTNSNLNSLSQQVTQIKDNMVFMEQVTEPVQSGIGSAVFTLPSGFTRDNCMPIAMLYKQKTPENGSTSTIINTWTNYQQASGQSGFALAFMYSDGAMGAGTPSNAVVCSLYFASDGANVYDYDGATFSIRLVLLKVK